MGIVGVRLDVEALDYHKDMDGTGQVQRVRLLRVRETVVEVDGGEVVEKRAEQIFVHYLEDGTVSRISPCEIPQIREYPETEDQSDGAYSRFKEFLKSKYADAKRYFERNEACDFMSVKSQNVGVDLEDAQGLFERIQRYIHSKYEALKQYFAGMGPCESEESLTVQKNDEKEVGSSEQRDKNEGVYGGIKHYIQGMYQWWMEGMMSLSPTLFYLAVLIQSLAATSIIFAIATRVFGGSESTHKYMVVESDLKMKMAERDGLVEEVEGLPRYYKTN